MFLRIPIKGYEDFYEIDYDGNIYSKDRTITYKNGKVVVYKGKQRKPIAYDTGYFGVTLTKNNKVKHFRWHRLVAEHFIPNSDIINKTDVNHIDGDKSNNAPYNLEWVTSKENMEHAVSYGLHNCKGTKNAMCNFSRETVKSWIYSLYHGDKIDSITQRFNCDRNTVNRLIKAEFPGCLGKYSGNYLTRVIKLPDESLQCS